MLITLLTILNLVVAGLLVLTIMIQRGDDGLGGAFGGASAQQIQMSNDPMSKATTWLGVLFMVSAVALGWAIAHQDVPRSVVDQAEILGSEDLPVPGEMPAENSAQ